MSVSKIANKKSPELEHALDSEFKCFGLQQDSKTKRWGAYVLHIKGDRILRSELFEGQTEEEHQFAEDQLLKAMTYEEVLKS